MKTMLVRSGKISFSVPGPPVPKERARVAISKSPNGKTKAHAFTPDRTAAYEQHVKLHALAARCKTSKWPHADPSVKFVATIEIHRSAKRGDWDNFAKAITDACNGVLWLDDRQICAATVKVFEALKGLECAKVEVEAWT